MGTVTVYGLYLDRTDVAPEMWDLCGIYSTHDKALEARARMLAHPDDFAIDPIIVDVDIVE